MGDMSFAGEYTPMVKGKVKAYPLVVNGSNLTPIDIDVTLSNPEILQRLFKKVKIPRFMKQIPNIHFKMVGISKIQVAYNN